MKVTLKRLESKNYIYFDEDIDELVRISKDHGVTKDTDHFQSECCRSGKVSEFTLNHAYHVTSISM